MKNVKSSKGSRDQHLQRQVSCNPAYVQKIGPFLLPPCRHQPWHTWIISYSHYSSFMTTYRYRYRKVADTLLYQRRQTRQSSTDSFSTKNQTQQCQIANQPKLSPFLFLFILPFWVLRVGQQLSPYIVKNASMIKADQVHSPFQVPE